MKVAFYTLGCKVNQYETNVMIEKMINSGYEIVDFDSRADIYVINTCTVTNMSDRKSRQILKRAKKINENGIVVVTGCLAQVGSDELSKVPEIDLIIGNEEKKNIDKYINEYIEDKSNNIEVSNIMDERIYTKENLSTFFEKARAIIKVQDGCENYCSYCIIPFARGRIRSKNVDDVINEITDIANNGYKEVVITGIHVASYGKDLDEDITLIDLIEKISNIQGIERIRLGSLEPTIVTEDFLERTKKLSNFCHHFHLSLQSGCNSTLKRMNRKYSIEQFEQIVNLIRKYYKDANITTDIIVGFPGETDEEFEQTYNFLKKIKLSKMHIFQYSQRKGTVATRLPNQIDPKIKHERSEKLIKLSNDNEKKFLSGYIGKEVEVLIEENNENISKGFTKNYLHTVINEKININEIIKLKARKIENNALICEK